MRNKILHFLFYVGRYTCLYFTVILVLIACLDLFPSMVGRITGAGIFQCLLQAAFAAVLSFVVFSDSVIRRGSAAVRYLIYLAILLSEVYLASRLFGWFGGEHAALVMLGFIAASVLAVCGLLALRAKLQQRQYAEKLREYHQKRGE